ncbi:hypothetical protein MB46_02350 [Arthrobacter alpinus]|uniref:TadE/TadG family type IV pilus assembly protein n=1 Tax=Arthrobacter alpinus TaxID=656366 RepID=UPI0005CA698A|nr:TadE/TadG family type IV pilus assembly protein [Arthrobacter alpinus]ALV44531.1 hypothetical protein MB46_02350 [Arthrobacter alpinus]
MKFSKSERGAAAVEFALVVPMLMAIVFGIIVCGQAFTMQIAVTQAGRAAVRSMAVSELTDSAAAKSAAIALANSNKVGGATFSYSFSQDLCQPKTAMTVTVTTTVNGIGLLPDFNLSGIGSMQCGG